MRRVSGGNSASKSLASGLGFVLPPLMGLWKTVLAYKEPAFELETKTQHYTVDHLARGSMKNGANSVTQCELQDT